MTRFSKLLVAAALGGTALAGTAYAAHDQAATPARHHHGHGDMFAKLDANGDGVITRAEAIAAADADFAKNDTNGNGQITRDEVKAQRQAMRAKWQAKAGADQSADAAGAGKAGRHHMRHGGMAMKGLDANKDGVVTKAEAEAAATARFDAADTNHDGKLDQTEIAAAKAEMRAKMQAMRAQRQAAQPPTTSTDQPAPADDE